MRRIMGLWTALFIPTFLSAGTGDSPRELQTKELKALIGTWKAVRLEVDGKPLPKEAIPDFTFIIGAEGKCVGRFAKGEYQSTLSVDPAKTPRTMDNLHETGANKGKRQYGVYKLEGDRLTVNMTAPGAKESDRPKDLNTKGTPTALFIFERAKDAKEP